MENYTFNKEIKTIGELKQYINKPLFFSYNTFNGDITYAWIKLLTEIEIPKDVRDDNPQGLYHLGTYGLNSMQIMRDGKINIKFLKNDITKPSYSNAQEHIRTLTKEEFKMYKEKTIVRKWKPYSWKFQAEL